MEKQNSSIAKYAKKVVSALGLWRESGDNNRGFILMTNERIMFKDSNTESMESIVAIEGNTRALTKAVYNAMKENKHFKSIVMGAATEYSVQTIKKMLNKNKQGDEENEQADNQVQE